MFSKDNNACKETSGNQGENSSIASTKFSFKQYFNIIGNKSFKQFYFDWHINAMIEPFAELSSYFMEKYPDDAEERFKEFTKQFKEGTELYNVDSEKFCSIKQHITPKDDHLSKIIDKIETFSFEIRQFVFAFATDKDYTNEFGNWVFKPNYPYSHLHGLAIASDVLQHMSENFTQLNNSQCSENSRKLVDTYLRDNIAPDYKYNDQYTYRYRKSIINHFVNLRNRMGKEFLAGELDTLQDTFQIEQKNVSSPFGQYRPNGFELEFYVPEEYGDYSKLIQHLKDTHQWKTIYTSSKHPEVYSDNTAAGVIERDESLAAMRGLAPVEYASRIMHSKKDEEDCLKIVDSFEQGYANVHCSLHQHISSDGFSLDTYKRLVKRMMQHEGEIVANFAAPERRDNHLLYATYISKNLSSDNIRDYPFLCVMVDICDNLDELREMVGFGHKYKTLNIMPDHTVEFRYMNAVFNKPYIKAFLQFNRDFVNSAVENNSEHLNRFLLNKFNWLQITHDKKTELRDLSYYYQRPYDQFRPDNTVDAHSIYEENVYALQVANAIVTTGKAKYYNSWFNKKVRDAYGR